jgi:anaerobic magnesium-protoporphyrin IX monomethyl ester cyclase
MGHFIFGLPGETRQTARQSIDFAKKLGLDYIQCYCAIPYPGTKLGELAQTQGWIKASKWSNYDLSLSIMRNDELTAKEIKFFRDRALRSFYLRPSFIIKQLTQISFKQVLKAANFWQWIKGR